MRSSQDGHTKSPIELPPGDPNPDQVRDAAEYGATLKRTVNGRAIPFKINAFDGMVAAPGFSTASVFTSPNQRWVPEFAVAHGEITTYTDGRWGRHEYSRWPQAYARDSFHVACIPRTHSIDDSSPILWQTLALTDWKEDQCGVNGVGFLKDDLMHQLEAEAGSAIDRLALCRRDRKEWNEVGRFLTVCLRHTIDRLRVIPAAPGVVISLAAHVQRLALELAGLRNLLNHVLDRLESQRDFKAEVLDVLGVHSADPSVVQVLFRAGIPVWFQQPITKRLVIYEVVSRTDVPVDFSTVPAYPRLVLAKRDISGVLNTAGEWARAMNAMVRRQLCGSGLPELLRQEPEGDEHRPKRTRREPGQGNGWSSSLGSTTPVVVVRNPEDAKALGHDLRSAVTASSHTSPALDKKPARRSRYHRAKPNQSATESMPAPMDVGSCSSQPFTSTVTPFRQYYSSYTVSISAAWEKAFNSVGRLPQPAKSPTFYYPLPWNLDRLIGPFVGSDFLTALSQVAPSQLGNGAMRYGGDYEGVETAEAKGSRGRAAARQQMKLNLRQLFGKLASLRSYDASSMPEFNGRQVTYEIASTDNEVQ
ncbi:hypothetical protein ONZ51_g7480 [Trametes cubensis]|uniref:Uncharacterized protein n=1 Tax=Trametes cubensis TaxID=1111947 RepID=A0AAD7TQ16_9APHY|nr:hypothetical protein ONZ51_g7480 [Trametes cubensis]